MNTPAMSPCQTTGNICTAIAALDAGMLLVLTLVAFIMRGAGDSQHDHSQEQ